MRKPKDHLHHPSLSAAETNFQKRSTIKKTIAKPQSYTGKVNLQRVFNKVILEFMGKEDLINNIDNQTIFFWKFSMF